jgi:hypothetical protein
MTDDSARSSAFLDQVRRRRDALHEHIRQSEINIANSKEVLRQVDQIIGDAKKQEWGLSEMSPTSIAPTCPHCAAPLRLIRVLPRVPLDAPVETRTFRCSGCGKITTRTVRIDDDRA